jgi:hypothetical protein
MTYNIEDIEGEVMKLSIEARAQLAGKLILSLDAPSEEENLRFWVVEAEKRLKNLRDGNAREISAEEAFREAKTRIS